MKPVERLLISSAVAICLLQYSSIAQASQSNRFGESVPAAGESLAANPVSLPDLPEYTGEAKLEKVMAFPANGQIERSVSLTYATKSPADSVIAWYRGALGMYRWTIENEDKDVLVAVQERSGNTCNIYCDEEGNEGCNLHISYSFHKQSSD
jgi:hypothetical protein